MLPQTGSIVTRLGTSRLRTASNWPTREVNDDEPENKCLLFRLSIRLSYWKGKKTKSKTYRAAVRTWFAAMAMCALPERSKQS